MLSPAPSAWILPQVYPSNQKEGHGYDTRSIYNFVQKYHGVLECTTQEEEFILKLLV